MHSFMDHLPAHDFFKKEICEAISEESFLQFEQEIEGIEAPKAVDDESINLKEKEDPRQYSGELLKRLSIILNEIYKSKVNCDLLAVLDTSDYYIHVNYTSLIQPYKHLPKPQRRCLTTLHSTKSSIKNLKLQEEPKKKRPKSIILLNSNHLGKETQKESKNEINEQYFGDEVNQSRYRRSIDIETMRILRSKSGFSEHKFSLKAKKNQSIDEGGKISKISLRNTEMKELYDKTSKSSLIEAPRLNKIIRKKIKDKSILWNTKPDSVEGFFNKGNNNKVRLYEISVPKGIKFKKQVAAEKESDKNIESNVRKIKTKLKQKPRTELRISMRSSELPYKTSTPKLDHTKLRAIRINYSDIPYTYEKNMSLKYIYIYIYIIIIIFSVSMDKYGPSPANRPPRRSPPSLSPVRNVRKNKNYYQTKAETIHKSRSIKKIYRSVIV